MSLQSGSFANVLVDLDIAKLCATLDAQPDVIAAYVFGSTLTGRARASSDVDIAILLDRSYDDDAPHVALKRFERRLELGDAISEFIHPLRTADVAILNRTSPIFQHQVLSTGEVIYERNPSLRADFEVMSGKVYADLIPMREFFARSMRDELREGAFGERRRHRARTAGFSTR